MNEAELISKALAAFEDFRVRVHHATDALKAMSDPIEQLIGDNQHLPAQALRERLIAFSREIYHQEKSLIEMEALARSIGNG